MSIILDTGSGDRIELALAHRQTLLERKQSLLRWHMAYWLFSAIDLLLTIASFRIGGIEMNPIASWFYSQFGISSLITYKVMMVVVIALQLAYIGKHKLHWARRIYSFGIATLCVASTMSLCQVIWFIHQYGWDIFVSSFRYAF
jgi:hypothetical protein